LFEFSFMFEADDKVSVLILIEVESKYWVKAACELKISAIAKSDNLYKPVMFVVFKSLKYTSHLKYTK